jgi:hypothetical protein
MEDCAGADPGSDCCVYCEELLPAARRLRPGEEARVLWDGGRVFQVDDDYCRCSCSHARTPVPMAYRASSCAYDAVDCFGEPCRVDADGVVWNASPSGASSCAEAVFDLPYAGGEVVVAIP